MVAVTLALELLLMNIIGIFIRKSGVVDKSFSTQLTNVLMKFCIPCLIFYSISNAVEFSMEALSNCGIVILLGAVGAFLSLAIGQLFYILGHKTGFARIMRYSLTFCHFSFMGIPVMSALFGDMGTFYYAFFLIPVRICYYSLSESLMTPGGKAGGKGIKSILLNPQLIAVAVGMVFWIMGWKLPTAINYCVKSLNTICSPMALLLCGMVIAEYDFRQLIRPAYLKIPVLRTIMMPIIFFIITRVFLMLGVEPMLCQMLVIYTAFPTASLLPVYALKYDPDPENQLNAAGASIISVLISAVTVPIWYMILS